MKKIFILCAAVITTAMMSVHAVEFSGGLVGGLGIGLQAKVMFTENLGLMDGMRVW